MLTEGIIAGAIGAGGAALVAVISALFKRNQNRKDQYDHEEKLIELSSNLQNTNKVLKDFTSLSRDFEYVKEGMNQLHEEIKDLKNEVIEVKTQCASTDVMLLRREIYAIYFRYEKEREIPEREFESVLNLYTVYKSLGGNGTCEQYVNEIKAWKRT